MKTRIATDDKAIIAKAKQLLADKEITQKRLALAMHITESELSLLLSGKRPWSLKYLRAFVDATGEKVEI